MTKITINGISFDPTTSAGTFGSAGLEIVDGANSNYILIQTSEPLSPDQKEELVNLGVVIHEYVSESTYLCGCQKGDLSQIRNLSFVKWANVYLQGLKVAPSLRAAATQTLPTSVAAPYSRSCLQLTWSSTRMLIQTLLPSDQPSPPLHT